MEIADAIQMSRKCRADEWSAAPASERRAVLDILEHRSLCAVFQPILDMGSDTFIGFEGLIRGPSDSPLHSPASLFCAAQQCGLSLEIEMLCRQVVLEAFAQLKLPGRLFLNVS